MNPKVRSICHTPKGGCLKAQGLERSDFKSMTMAAGIPYQNLINLYLLDCAKTGRKRRSLGRNEIAERGCFSGEFF